MKLSICVALVFAVFLAGVQAKSACLFPREHWCDSIQIARACGVLASCNQRLESKNEAQKVKLQVYFESYCADSQRFIINQLYPTWLDLKSIMDIELVSYGKATTTEDVNGNYDFECHHGERECTGNKIQNCGILHSGNDEEIYIPFIHCMMGALNPNTGAKQCALDVNLDYSKVETCANNQEGDKLLAEAGEKTHALNPVLTWVPWIVLNDVHTDAIQQQGSINLRKLICDTYTGEKPEKCTS